MDPDTEVDFDLSLFLIRYKSGRVHRLMGTARVEAGTDAVTGVTSKDVVIDAQSGLAARLYLPGEVPGLEKLPVIVCIHGGGFVVHSAFSRVHSRFLNTLVAAEGVVAVSVDYSLAPEHPLPTAYDDAWPALGWTVASCSSSGQEPWLAEHGDTARLFVASDSAGANIAHNVTMRAGKDGLPGGGGARIDGMVLLHPFFRGGELVPSERTDPELPRRAERSWGFMCAGRYGIDHPFINPLSTPAEEWAALGCRQALVTVGELDTMRDRARMYVEALRGSAWGGEEAALYETGARATSTSSRRPPPPPGETRRRQSLMPSSPSSSDPAQQRSSAGSESGNGNGSCAQIRHRFKWREN